MKSNLAVLSIVFWLMACNVKQPPYFKQKLAKWERLPVGCGSEKQSFSAESNIIGQRYLVQRCLHSGYDGHYTAERRGDTVAVRFTDAAGPKALFRLTLDVDTYPSYRFLSVDDETYVIGLTQN